MQQHIQAGAGQQTKPRKGVNVLIQTSGLQTSCKEKGSAAGNGKKEKRKVMDQKSLGGNESYKALEARSDSIHSPSVRVLYPDGPRHPLPSLSTVAEVNFGSRPVALHVAILWRLL